MAEEAETGVAEEAAVAELGTSSVSGDRVALFVGAFLATVRSVCVIGSPKASSILGRSEVPLLASRTAPRAEADGA